MSYVYSYKDILGRSEKITWRVEDLIGGEKALDFSAPFMPESLSRIEGLSLSPREKLLLNQIRGHTYLSMFGLVEEFILPFVLDHTRAFVTGEDYRARAYLEFAGEEAKHIQLFRRFKEHFAAGFGSPCDVIGPAEDIAKHVLSHDALGVALVILQIEWMSQRHYVESVRDTRGIDACFKSLLSHHWMEEMQHAQLDTMLVESMAEGVSESDMARAMEAYFAIGAFLDGGLKQQAAFDIEALERASDRRIGEEERAHLVASQHQANRWTYIGSAMSHPRFLETLGTLSPAARRQVEDAIPTFS